MKAAILNKKTVVVWNDISDEEAEHLLHTLTDIIKSYQKAVKDLGNELQGVAIPIPCDNEGRYISVVHKNGNIVLSTTRTDGSYVFTPLLNGDTLYKNIDLLEDGTYDISKRVNVHKKNHELWINGIYSNAVRSYLLSPNPNPQDFIESLKRGDLPGMYRKFLDDVGVALKDAEKIDVREDDYGL